MGNGNRNNTDILLALLAERYEASHKMRDRSLGFALWLLGFLVLGGGWLTLNSARMGGDARVMLSLIVGSVSVSAYLFISDIKRGFERNWGVILKLEKAMGCFEEGALIDGETLYPDSYKTPAQTGLLGHFGTTSGLIVVAFVILEILIWWGVPLSSG